MAAYNRRRTLLNKNFVYEGEEKWQENFCQRICGNCHWACYGATYAWFTAESEEFTNEFTAGTVEIEADEEVNTKGFDENNWNPGDEAEKEFTIINKGTKGIRLSRYL